MKSIVTILTCAFTFLFFQSYSQGPFNCTAEAYLFQYNDVFAINLASGQAVPVGTDISEGNLNAMAYNPSDGYIWGYISTPANSVARIGNDFSVETFEIAGYRSAYIGAIDADGIFYSKSGGTSYDVVDLNPNSVTYLTVLQQGTLSLNISIADWAINAVDGMIYTVAKNSNILYRIDPTTSVVTDLGEVPALSGVSYTYGAVYFDVDGNFYVSANQTGTIYMIQTVQDITAGGSMSSNLFAYGPASGSNDGARCPTAPVPQEICDNGIDDDGDGLVDCDDPSCSGITGCPDVNNVSGGNDGGLESNNRLSQAIAKRNYIRAKATKEKASTDYLPNYDASSAIVSKNGNIILEDLVPVGILGETHAVESSPEDLIDITNASEVFAVDYYNDEISLASVLALKTEGKVYEHSKFICDRLLGAQVNSVSTIYLKDQPFIRTIIYHEEGNREFVLSFSVRLTDAGAVIESHWNLDKYTEDADYYNFQIWTNSINDLMKLSEGILDLVDVRAPIASYDNSEPPYVFVKKAAYNKGKLLLEVMNNNFSTELLIEGGVRRTETSNEEELSETISIKPYSNLIEVDLGNIFDLGFRITADKLTTPDDLFISDGPWGYDDSAEGTVVKDYEIVQSKTESTEDNYVVERGVELSARVKEYVSAYRALTPRFKSVDLSEFSSMHFEASGSGQMEISLIKESISEWKEQLHATVELSEDVQEYDLSIESFATINGEQASWDDIKLITFTWRSPSGESEEMQIKVGEIQFSTKRVSAVSNQIEDGNLSKVQPNPFADATTILFSSNKATMANIFVVDALGAKIMENVVMVDKGENEYALSGDTLQTGKYYIIINMLSGDRITKEIIKVDY